MKSLSLVALVGLGAALGLAVGLTIHSARSDAPDRAARLREEIEAALARLNSIAARMESATPITSVSSPSRVTDPLPQDEAHAPSGASPALADAASLDEIRERLRALAEDIAALRHGLDNGTRMHELLAKALPTNWIALQEYGIRWRNPDTTSAARSEVVYLSCEEFIARFGRPTSINVQSPSGTLWCFTRDRTRQRVGDIWNVKANLDSAGFVIEVWDVEVVEPAR